MVVEGGMVLKEGGFCFITSLAFQIDDLKLLHAKIEYVIILMTKRKMERLSKVDL